MNVDLGLGLGAMALVIGFPLLLLVLLVFLGRLESWMLLPDERAAQVSALLEQVEEADELEHAVALMMAEVTPTPVEHRGSDRAARRWALRLAGARRAESRRETVQTRG